MQFQVAPSILSADFLNLGHDIRMLNDNADLIHLDVMDGEFVPNLSFGFAVVDAVSRIAKIPMDAHLMVIKPHRWFERLASDGVRMVSFHLEASGRRCSENIRMIHDLGMKAGVAIDPDVRVNRLFRYALQADFFLIMSVFAGFGGQQFMPESIDRVAQLRSELDRVGSKALIEVDGGVNPSNAALLRNAGADIVVAGSSVFKSGDPGLCISELRGE